MIKPELKYLHSPDILEIQIFIPEKADDFGFLLQIIVGRDGFPEDGESFDDFVCTPKWLLNNHKKDDIVFGLHHLIVFEYSYEKIYNKLSNIINKMRVSSWQEFGSEFGKFGKWEFDNYQE